MTKLRVHFVLAVVLVATGLFGVTAPSAAAATYWCSGTGGWPHQHCWVGYQQFPYGQTTGLRSSMQGYADGPNIGITASQQGSGDEIYVKLRVWDLKEDGYRARVWADVFKGCACVDDGYKVASKTFDAHNNLGTTPDPLWYTTDAAQTYYTVRLRLGRFRGSDGHSEWGEEQRYYLVVNGTN